MKSFKQTLAILIVALAVYGAFSLFQVREPNNEVSEEFRRTLADEGIVIQDGRGIEGVSNLFNTFEGAPSLSESGDVSSGAVPSALLRSHRADSPEDGLEEAPAFSEPASHYADPFEVDDAPPFDATLFDTPSTTAFPEESSEIPDTPSNVGDETGSSALVPEPSHRREVSVNSGDYETTEETDVFAPEPLPDLRFESIAGDSSTDALANASSPEPPAMPSESGEKESDLSQSEAFFDAEFEHIVSRDEPASGQGVAAPTPFGEFDVFPGSREDHTPLDEGEDSYSPEFLAGDTTRAETSRETPSYVSMASHELPREHYPVVVTAPVAADPIVTESISANGAATAESPTEGGSEFLSFQDLDVTTGSTLSAADAKETAAFLSHEGFVPQPPRKTLHDPESDQVFPLPPVETEITAQTGNEFVTEMTADAIEPGFAANPGIPGETGLSGEGFDMYSHARIPDAPGASAFPLEDADILRNETARASTSETAAVGMARSRQRRTTSSPGTPLPETARTDASPEPAFRDEVARQITQIKDILNHDDYRRGHRMLTQLYFADLSPEERQVLIPLANKCGWGEFFSRDHFPTDPLYAVRENDTLESVAAAHEISPALLMKINAFPSTANVIPGQYLKVPRGPFHARISLSRRELVVTAQDLYVCRFRLGTGKLEEIPEGDFRIETKFENPDYIGEDGSQISHTDPRNPLGSHWIGLGGALGLHGTNAPQYVGTDSCEVEGFSFENKDIAEIYDILTEKSIISIRK